MSADNYLFVRKDKPYGWAVGQEFASCEPGPIDKSYQHFTTKEAAMDFAMTTEAHDYYEYGVVVEDSESEQRMREEKAVDQQTITDLVMKAFTGDIT